MKHILLICCFYSFQFAFCQEIRMKPIDQLVNKQEPGWQRVEAWMKESKNSIEVLKKDSILADSALYHTQVTTRSPMGAIIHETGGILIDHGWIRILGSGSDKLKRSLPEWNRGKTFEQYGEPISVLLVADDAIGGFFAINGGAFGKQDLGKLYYFSPDNLNWEPLGIGYSEFVYWTFTGDLEEFYKGLRWKKWKEEVSKMGADEAMSFYPFLWADYEDLEKLSRKAVPVEETWSFQMDMREQLDQNK